MCEYFSLINVNISKHKQVYSGQGSHKFNCEIIIDYRLCRSGNQELKSFACYFTDTRLCKDFSRFK